MKSLSRLSPLLASILMLVSPLVFAGPPSVEWMIHILIYIVVLALIFWLVWWFVGYVGLPEPFNKVARVIIGLIAFILLLYLLLGILGPFPTR